MLSTADTVTPLAQGFCLGASPRWFEGLLWFSDKLGEAVHTVNLAGSVTTLTLPGHAPSGLGFRPDGSLLIACAETRRLLRYDGEIVAPIADLTVATPADLGDMVVDHRGRAYIGSQAFADGVIVRVDPDGSTTTVAGGLDLPSGMVITADGATLIVAESAGRRLTAFSIDDDGSLYDRRVVADGLDGPPDGITLDADGGVWAALTLAHQFQRLQSGGVVTDRVDIGDRTATACTLGGPGRRTLFLLSSSDAHTMKPAGARRSRVDALTVQCPGAGLP
jgi:sugar lactone lactonase YvrE